MFTLYLYTYIPRLFELIFIHIKAKYSGCRPGTGDSTFGTGPGGRRMTSPATFETPEEPRRENDPRRPESSGTRLVRRKNIFFLRFLTVQKSTGMEGHTMVRTFYFIPKKALKNLLNFMDLNL